MANKLNIRDPVHNYIYMTDVEESVVQHPLFQRLRFISQNGTAYLTYPSNKHDRFLHSLGVMKIGGDIFLNATEDLTNFQVKNYLSDAYRFIKRQANELNVTIVDAVNSYISANNQTFQKYGLSFHEDNKYIMGELYSEDSIIAHKFSKVLLFQSLRLACLLHDIGHFPYSHTTEYAFAEYIAVLQSNVENNNRLNENEQKFLNDYLNMKQTLNVGIDKAIHEVIGIKMLDEILPSKDLTDFQRLSRTVARKILSEHEMEPVLATIYNTVAGELDADRLDYSLRDPYTSGLELGQIDMERLLNNFTLVANNSQYMILPKVQSLSTIETFYHNRYLSHKYLIYHHSKARMDQIIGGITFQLISIFFNSGPENEQYGWLHQILKQNNFQLLWSKLNGVSPIQSYGDEDYYYCDEGWLNSLLKQIYFKSKDLDIKNKEIKMLMVLIKTFIFRKTDNIVSLFKRYMICI